MARSLNKVQLIGNLTRDPEQRATPNGASITSLTIATNRNWTTDAGEKKEDTEFHKIITWNKLADLTAHYAIKGSKVFIEGRLATRKFTDKEGNERAVTEVIATDVIFLDDRKGGDTNVRYTTNERGEVFEPSQQS